MNLNFKILPEDPLLLKELLTESLLEIEKLKVENRRLQEQINVLLAKRFGPSSEKQTFDISGQFDEAEKEQENPDSKDLEFVEVPAHTRNKPKRKPFPKIFLREDVIHDLPVEERICQIDGSALVEVDQEVSEQLEIIPTQIKVIRNIRLKYGCPHCHKGIITASMPPQPIPKRKGGSWSISFYCNIQICRWSASISTDKYTPADRCGFVSFDTFQLDDKTWNIDPATYQFIA